MNYFPKTAYLRHLLRNAESVDNTTNPSFKNPFAPYVAENDADFGMVLKINMLQCPCVRNNFQKYEEVCE